jgi:TRAP-type uncharacterized transport system substrate-binding protein
MEMMERIGIVLTALLCATLAMALAVPVAAVVIGVFHSKPAFTMATGRPGLGYDYFGRQTAEKLRESVEVGIKQTNGSPENLKMLLDKRADAALVQGGSVTDAGTAPNLVSLGTAFNEPVWIFRRRDAARKGPAQPSRQSDLDEITAEACLRIPKETRAAAPAAEGGINSLRGKTIAIGPKDSGTQQLACELLWLHRMTRPLSHFRPLPMKAATDDLLNPNGAIDAAIFVVSSEAEDIKRLLGDPNIELVGDPQAEAYELTYPYLHQVAMPRGIRDFADDLPSDSTPLTAAKAQLFVRDDLDHAIQFLLLKAGGEVYAKKDILLDDAKFPSAETAGVPPSPVVKQFYDRGLPYYVNSFLIDHLPFWAADWIIWAVEPLYEVWFYALVVLGVLAPLAHFAPVVYNWWTQRPVLQMLVDVMGLEVKADLAIAAGDRKGAGKIALELDGLKRQASAPLLRGTAANLTAVLLMLLHQHINALHRRLERYLSKDDGPEKKAHGKTPVAAAADVDA